MKASDLFVKALENEGVEYIFAVPGEENLDLLESLRHSKIKLIVTRHEQGAGFMAATYGRLTGKTGVCLSTLGPGATNLVTAGCYAQLGGMPMLMVTGQKPIKKSKQGKFQVINTIAMFRQLTKFTKQIVSGGSIPSLVREVFRVAEEERPGAVHLELPEDIAEESVDPNSYIFEVKHVFRGNADERVIDEAVEMIQRAKRPLILIGAGANRQRTSEALAKFIEKTGIPFFNTQMGKGVIDERHPLYLGTAALSEGDYLHCAIERADLIINVGHDVIEKPPFIMTQEGTRKVIHINFFPAQIDHVYFPHLVVVGDIAITIRQLTAKTTKSQNWDFDYYMRIKQEVETHTLNGSTGDRFPLLPQQFVACVREVMPSDGIVALDNGMYKIWFARNYKAHQPNTLLLDNALATMGAGLPSAMTASLLYPDRKIMAVCGDGGFMMNSQELETAVRLKLNLTVVILNDSGYGMIKWKQEAMGFGDYGLDFNNPDFVKYAESYGAQGHRVTAAAELSNILTHSLSTPGVHVVEVPVDYSENVKTLNDELKSKTCLL
ncbi:MAG: acetolactate synthase large subunit [Gammaproteobacteria bacterium]